MSSHVGTTPADILQRHSRYAPQVDHSTPQNATKQENGPSRVAPRYDTSHGRGASAEARSDASLSYTASAALPSINPLPPTFEPRNFQPPAVSSTANTSSQHAGNYPQTSPFASPPAPSSIPSTVRLNDPAADISCSRDLRSSPTNLPADPRRDSFPGEHRRGETPPLSPAPTTLPTFIDPSQIYKPYHKEYEQAKAAQATQTTQAALTPNTTREMNEATAANNMQNMESESAPRAHSPGEVKIDDTTRSGAEAESTPQQPNPAEGATTSGNRRNNAKSHQYDVVTFQPKCNGH